jgi:hypothetical protein
MSSQGYGFHSSYFHLNWKSKNEKIIFRGSSSVVKTFALSPKGNGFDYSYCLWDRKRENDKNNFQML